MKNWRIECERCGELFIPKRPIQTICEPCKKAISKIKIESAKTLRSILMCLVGLVCTC